MSKNIAQLVNDAIQDEMSIQRLSRAELASKLKIKPVNVSVALNNVKRDWKIATLERWANAMGCDLRIEICRRRNPLKLERLKKIQQVGRK